MHRVVLKNRGGVLAVLSDEAGGEILDDIMCIARELEKDPYFLPNTEKYEEEYIYEERKIPPPRLVCCYRLNVWGDWRVFWSFRYDSVLQATLDAVIIVVRRDKRPLERLEPRDS